jgi:hypothetical protein
MKKKKTQNNLESFFVTLRDKLKYIKKREETRKIGPVSDKWTPRNFAIC